MYEILSTKDLRLGMFVAELDRPWLGTPFLIQGFVVENDEQIATLRDLCRFVTVDRARSIGDEYRPDAVWKPQRRSREEIDPQIIYYQTKSKMKLPPLAVQEVRHVGRHRFPAVAYQDTIRIEDELHSAEDSYANAQHLLVDIAEQVNAGRIPDVEHAERTVDGLVECVVRNPDALLWMSRLKRTDNETYDHALSVSIHLMAFARHLGLPPDEMHDLGMAALLKNIGYLRLPSELIHKPGGLTASERAKMHGHVQIGCELLARDFPLPEVVFDIIAKHHERIDGSGYPAHLTAEEIGLLPEMTGLVDCYCAMSYPRAFRPARNPQWVIDEINAMREARFTGAVVDEFVQFIGLYPVGTLVEMNSGEVGVVFEQNRIRRLKPRIMLLLGPDKTRNPSPGILNMLNDPLICEGKPYRIVRILPAGSFGIDIKEFYL